MIASGNGVGIGSFPVQAKRRGAQVLNGPAQGGRTRQFPREESRSLASLEVPRFAPRGEAGALSRVVLVVRGELDIATIADVQTALDELRVSGWSD